MTGGRAVPSQSRFTHLRRHSNQVKLENGDDVVGTRIVFNVLPVAT